MLRLFGGEASRGRALGPETEDLIVVEPFQ